jgi:hypothetical protein
LDAAALPDAGAVEEPAALDVAAAAPVAEVDPAEVAGDAVLPLEPPQPTRASEPATVRVSARPSPRPWPGRVDVMLMVILSRGRQAEQHQQGQVIELSSMRFDAAG